MKPEILANLIISLGEQWSSSLENYVMLIEGFRVTANRVLQNAADLETVEKLVNVVHAGKSFGIDITASKIKKLFKGL
jgi:hypothetical protein